jgi:hypothetical protein
MVVDNRKGMARSIVIGLIMAGIIILLVLVLWIGPIIARTLAGIDAIP